jgi:hypothetical protein
MSFCRLELLMRTLSSIGRSMQVHEPLNFGNAVFALRGSPKQGPPDLLAGGPGISPMLPGERKTAFGATT